MRLIIRMPTWLYPDIVKGALAQLASLFGWPAVRIQLDGTQGDSAIQVIGLSGSEFRACKHVKVIFHRGDLCDHPLFRSIGRGTSRDRVMGARILSTESICNSHTRELTHTIGIDARNSAVEQTLTLVKKLMEVMMYGNRATDERTQRLRAEQRRRPTEFHAMLYTGVLMALYRIVDGTAEGLPSARPAHVADVKEQCIYYMSVVSASDIGYAARTAYGHVYVDGGANIASVLWGHCNRLCARQ